jgi:hypothetical protein
MSGARSTSHAPSPAPSATLLSSPACTLLVPALARRMLRERPEIGNATDGVRARIRVTGAE